MQKRCPDGARMTTQRSMRLSTVAPSFSSRDLGRNVVGLDIEVHPAIVIDTLDLHAQLTGRGLEHDVVAARSGMVGVDRPAERPRPEFRRRADVVDVAVDQDAVDARAVHSLYSHSIVPGGFEV